MSRSRRSRTRLRPRRRCRVPWPVLASPLSLAALAPRRARRRSRRPPPAAAPALKACRGQDGLRLRDARRPARPHRRRARDRRRCTSPSSAGGPTPLLIALVGRARAVGGLVGLVVRALAGPGAAPLPPRRARPARHRRRACCSCPNLQRLRSLDAVHARRRVAACAQPHRPAARLLRDRRHRARPRRAAPGARRRQGRAHGHLLRHARRAAVRAGVPGARRPARSSTRSSGPTAPTPFLLDTYRNLPRVLREQCARGALPRRDRATRSPTSAALVRAHQRERPAARPLLRRARQRRRDAYATPDELLLPAHRGRPQPVPAGGAAGGDRAARRGDPAPLLRLRRIGQGGADARTRTCRFGLNVTTGCPDVALPYPRDRAGRRARGRSPSRRWRRSRRPTTRRSTPQTVLRTSYVDDCLAWPGDADRAPFTGPLPDVPALLLGGRLDIAHAGRERARDGRSELPHATSSPCRARATTRSTATSPAAPPRRWSASSTASRSAPVRGPGQRRAARRRSRRARCATSARRPASAATAGACCSPSSTPSSTRA